MHHWFLSESVGRFCVTSSNIRETFRKCPARSGAFSRSGAFWLSTSKRGATKCYHKPGATTYYKGPHAVCRCHRSKPPPPCVIPGSGRSLWQNPTRRFSRRFLYHKATNLVPYGMAVERRRFITAFRRRVSVQF